MFKMKQMQYILFESFLTSKNDLHWWSYYFLCHIYYIMHFICIRYFTNLRITVHALAILILLFFHFLATIFPFHISISHMKLVNFFMNSVYTSLA